MSNHSSLEMLIELAEGDRDAAAKLLGQLRSAHQQSHTQLEMLSDYRNDYLRRFEQAMQRGLTMASIQNYQRFLSSLDRAIEHQRQQVDQQQGRITRGMTNWQQQQKRVNSYDVLISRRRQEAEHRMNKLEQRQSDEYASRATSALGGF
ncbi:flagellar export protein FliJ [uncultured Kushneria sp.]|uniref:flagellar export protein FliJ n=1 Tax=uncultured Kushneria sp. TaxID=905033 RepID=UPI0026329407|nr:flagellar export protein FliJ [uncultured Kushneria sp.]